jgi:hypothetical protein
LNYADGPATPDGVQQVRMKSGADTKTSASLKGAGFALPAPVPVSETQVFAIDPAVTVQLRNSEGLCLTSDFTSASRNDGTRFLGQAP